MWEAAAHLSLWTSVLLVLRGQGRRRLANLLLSLWTFAATAHCPRDVTFTRRRAHGAPCDFPRGVNPYSTRVPLFHRYILKAIPFYTSLKLFPLVSFGLKRATERCRWPLLLIVLPSLTLFYVHLPPITKPSLKHLPPSPGSHSSIAATHTLLEKGTKVQSSLCCTFPILSSIPTQSICLSVVNPISPVRLTPQRLRSKLFDFNIDYRGAFPGDTQVLDYFHSPFKSPKLRVSLLISFLHVHIVALVPETRSA